MPECGYRPAGQWCARYTSRQSQPSRFRNGIETVLSENELEFFVIDEHQLDSSAPTDLNKTPLETYLVGGSEVPKVPVTVFTRDSSLSEQVWLKERGYPGNGAYLDFHKRHAQGGHRYWKITDADVPMQDKQPYHPDDAFLAHLGVVYRKFREYLTAPSWFGGSSGGMGRGSVPETGNGNTGIFPTPPSDARCEKSDPLCIAYFSAEFGITECLPLYSGGLGLLAGDYLKSTSYLGLPFVGVGLLYQHGYFRQRLTADGWQMAEYPANDFYNMPVQLARRADGTPVRVTVDYPRGTAYAQVWRAEVGRTALYLLDTNIDENGDEVLRNITSYLYGGDLRKRIEQEMLLGIGGYRALIALGICPTVCHMNEGHSGFMAVERIRQLMAAEHLSFDEAREASSAGNIFTTHTPVPAGIDLFPSDLVDNYLNGYYDALGISRDEFLALGRENPSDRESPFSMPILAFHLSATSNGVSRMHGDVSRRMWKNLWPNVPVDEVPIGSITNGIHIRSWVSNDMQSLFDRYLGPGWIQNLVDDQSTWTQIDQIPEVELWRTHERRRERLVAFARQRLKEQRMRVGASPAEIAATNEILDPSAITIGFARRFVTYKRAALLFHQQDRLVQLINQPERPVQFIFAGKAHPDDHEGKELIQKICKFIAQERFRYRIIFIEDYDICVASLSGSGC